MLQMVASAMIILFLFTAIIAVNFAFADDLQSTNFKILAPTIDVGLGAATSSNFTLIGSLGELSTGLSSSSDFQAKAGFLFFPGPIAPAPAPSPGSVGGPVPSGGIIPIFPTKLFLPLFVKSLSLICQKSDFNKDGAVSLVDISILLANWESAFHNPITDLNNDDKVDIIDLSIMLFCFSG